MQSTHNSSYLRTCAALCRWIILKVFELLHKAVCAELNAATPELHERPHSSAFRTFRMRLDAMLPSCAVADGAR